MKRTLAMLCTLTLTLLSTSTHASFYAPSASSRGYHKGIENFKYEVYKMLEFAAKQKPPTASDLQSYDQRDAFFTDFINSMITKAEKTLPVFAYLQRNDSKISQLAEEYFSAFTTLTNTSLLDCAFQQPKTYAQQKETAENTLNSTISEIVKKTNIAEQPEHQLLFNRSSFIEQEQANTLFLISDTINQLCQKLYPQSWYKRTWDYISAYLNRN